MNIRINSSYLTIVFCLFIFSLTAQKRFIPYERTARMDYVKGDEATITLEAESIARTVDVAAAYAEKNVLENLLFRGIPKSNWQQPLIANESDCRSKHEAFIDELTSYNTYKRFMIDSYTVQKMKGKKSFTVLQRVTFDMVALRKYLEENKVIRKFGF